MSTRSGACVWWSNARDRADREGLPRRGVTSRNYTGSLLLPSGGREVGRAPLDDAAAVAASTSGISCGPFPGGSGRGNRGSWGFSLESFAGASPPPPRKWQKPWEFPGLLPCSEIRGPWIWGPAATLAPFTASILCTLADAGATWASSALLQHIFTIFGGDEYMFGKKVFAAMLATVLGASLFGANAAKAVINLDSEDKSAAVAIYAAETITEAVPDSDGYYKVDGSDDDADNLNVTGMVGLGGSENSVVTIRFEFDGLVFSTAMMEGDLIVAGHTDINIRTGGGVGQNSVSFLATRGANASRTSLATLTILDIGVKPGVAGSVTMAVTDTLGPDKVTLNYNGAIRNTRALQEKAMPVDLGTTVEHRFTSFGGAAMGTLGSFIVGANTDLLAANDGAAVILGEDIIKDTVAMGSSVTISGDFSFATRAWLDTANTCTGDREPAEDGRRRGVRHDGADSSGSNYCSNGTVPLHCGVRGRGCSGDS